ncbi:hypothetical protein C8Q80DRAFT_902287 [Daedaleopsis nitida]|nr:hypothetical protein C8Q80DRAFT_902287 [Daedaleopsis nitida]
MVLATSRSHCFNEDMQELDEDFRMDTVSSILPLFSFRDRPFVQMSSLPCAGRQFKVNTLGVIHGIAAFLPLLCPSSAPLNEIVVISTGCADPKPVHLYGIADMAAYQITKAAALMATTKYALKLKDDRFVVVSLTPELVDGSDTSRRRYCEALPPWRS